MQLDAKKFRYFRFSPLKSKELLDEMKIIHQKRASIISEGLTPLGANGYRHYRGEVTNILWPLGHNFEDTPAIIVSNLGEHVSAKGNNRYKSGKAFNALKSETLKNINSRLKDLPDFSNFMFDKLGWERRSDIIGDYMCCATFFPVDGIIYSGVPTKLFVDPSTIKNEWVDGGDAYNLSPDMEELTFGQYYDLTGVQP